MPPNQGAVAKRGDNLGQAGYWPAASRELGTCSHVVFVFSSWFLRILFVFFQVFRLQALLATLWLA
jgi:hypothetical protein